MPPKKREKEIEVIRNRSADQQQADHELFLNAFEKPTQVYRFLRLRHLYLPIFLNRTLFYMKHRMSRSHKSRKGFRSTSLLDKFLELKNIKNEPEKRQGYLNVKFLGFFDKTISPLETHAKVEISVMKISHKKRKDSSSPLVQNFTESVFVPINPSEEEFMFPAIPIPAQSFNSVNGNVIKTYFLIIRVTTVESVYNEDNIKLEPGAKRSRNEKQYGSELLVFDKNNRLVLLAGNYDVVLTELPHNVKSSPRKSGNSWVTMDNMDSTQFNALQVIKEKPSLKFRLDWSDDPCKNTVEKPKPKIILNTDNNGNKENKPDTSRTAVQKTEFKPEPRMQIVYQFLYNNNSRQQTEACEDCTCPWCSLNCRYLYSLLKHLKLCHPRFTFAYAGIEGGARIDVAINEHYDGGYIGSPHDLMNQPGGNAFGRNGSVRRAPVTHILVCKPKKTKPTLAEFQKIEENDFDFEGQRPFVTGHNRLYHHTTTCLPVQPKEMDVDSEGENDPKWLQQKAIMMIEDFTDVNEGEKELMKLWNLHVMKHGFVGDCQIPLACRMFIKAKAEELLSKNLYRNLILHLCNLFDFGLLSSSTFFTLVHEFHDCVKMYPQAAKSIREIYVRQEENWLASGGEGGTQDKAQTPFFFKQDICTTSSSTSFISGDGTLRRKITQQTQIKKTMKTERNERRNSKNAINSKTEDIKSKYSHTEYTDPNHKRCKRKLSLQDEEKVSDVSKRRKSASTVERSLLQYRRKPYDK